MELNEVTIPYKTGEPIRICGLGDIHWGNIAVDEEALDRAEILYGGIAHNSAYAQSLGGVK